MAKQTVTLRLDEDDLNFLAQIEMPGAANLSEKIRGLLSEARAQREGRHDYSAAHDYARRLFASPERALNEAGVKSAMRSELVHRLLSWLPETTAYMLSSSSIADVDDSHREQSLRRIEQGVGERVMSLVDSVQQMAQAGFPGCHDPQSLTNRSQSALDLQRRTSTRPQGDSHE